MCWTKAVRRDWSAASNPPLVVVVVVVGVVSKCYVVLSYLRRSCVVYHGVCGSRTTLPPYLGVHVGPRVWWEVVVVGGGVSG